MAEDFQNIKWREISKSHFRGSCEVVMNLRQTIFIKYFLKKNYYFAVSGETKTGLPFNIPKIFLSNHYTCKKALASGDPSPERSIDVQFSPYEAAALVEAIKNIAKKNPDLDFGFSEDQE